MRPGDVLWGVRHEPSGQVDGWWQLRADAQSERDDVCEPHRQACSLVQTRDGGKTWEPAGDDKP